MRKNQNRITKLNRMMSELFGAVYIRFLVNLVWLCGIVIEILFIGVPIPSKCLQLFTFNVI